MILASYLELEIQQFTDYFSAYLQINRVEEEGLANGKWKKIKANQTG